MLDVAQFELSSTTRETFESLPTLDLELTECSTDSRASVMEPTQDPLSFYGKVAFIMGGIAILVLASNFIDYVLLRSEAVSEYEEVEDQNYYP